MFPGTVQGRSRPRQRATKRPLNLLLPRTRNRWFARLVALAAVPVLLPVACDGGAGADDARRTALEQRRRQLLNQFAAAQNQVRRTQAQALEDPSLAPLQENFYGLLRERMIELDPQSEPWLDRARELGPVIDSLSQPRILEPDEEPVPREERDRVVEEFAELERTLQPLQNQALADPEVAEAFEALQDSVHALMIRINPSAEAALDRMRRASAAVESLDAELRALEN